MVEGALVSSNINRAVLDIIKDVTKSTMRLVFVSLTGKETEIEVDSHDTVATWKSKVQAKEGIPPYQQSFLYPWDEPIVSDLVSKYKASCFRDKSVSTQIDERVSLLERTSVLTDSGTVESIGLVEGTRILVTLLNIPDPNLDPASVNRLISSTLSEYDGTRGQCQCICM
jgi:hypothetical protein